MSGQSRLADLITAIGLDVKTLYSNQTTARASSLYVIVYAAGAYAARPAANVVPAGMVRYIGPVQPGDWLTNDEWVNNT